MRGRLFTSLLFFVAAVALLRCAGGNIESKQAEPRLAPAQPNYTSELAQSMRDLDAELLEIQQLLEAGEDVDGVRITEYQFTALEPTDSSMLVDGFSGPFYGVCPSRGRIQCCSGCRDLFCSGPRLCGMPHAFLSRAA